MSSTETDWDALWKESPEAFHQFPENELVRWASTLAPGSRVLEVGCGNGANLQALEHFGLETYGVDISVAALEASVPLSRAFREAPVSATDLPFEDGFFDAVCDVQCFQHLAQDELPLAYREAARVLKPSGRFFEMFLVEGQAYFPDLDFCEFTSTPIKMAGLGFGSHGIGYYERHYVWQSGRQRHYRYVLIDGSLDGPSTLTRQG